MQIPVLIEPIASNGFRARCGEPFGVTAEGMTRDEALQRLRESIASRIAAGAEVTQLEVGPASHSWDRFVGTWAEGDPVIAEWEKEVEAYRREVDQGNTWTSMFGVFRDDPDFDEWQKAMAEYRQQMEEDPNAR
jgi:predicted RNase H-like HicB family nuclease